jgi:steroid delta-isomerase-like uncharacterized protein
MNAQKNALFKSAVEATTPNRIMGAFLAAWRLGNVVEAADLFGDEFTFIDHALQLEFKDKERLIEFLTKTYEFLPDTTRTDGAIYHSDDWVISEWTLTATHSEPFLGGRIREVPIRLQGISVVRMKNGKISHWSDYYDQLKSRRYRLAGWFTEWIEI